MLGFVEFLLRQQNPTRLPVPLPTTVPTPAEQAWLDSDLSDLGAHAPQDWAEAAMIIVSLTPSSIDARHIHSQAMRR